MAQGNPYSHHRRSPSGSNASKIRTARPALHRKGTSFVNHSISKLGAGPVKHQTEVDDSQPEMAASFLNFCAMCERQITVPDNSLLYCSESCRRKDSHKPLSASYSSNSSLSAPSTPPTSPPMSPRTIVAPMTPTKAPVVPTPAMRIPCEINDSKTIQDPSEWKPVIPMDSSSGSLASSEAWQYLSQFHGSQAPLLPVRRPKIEHRSSTSLSTLMSANGALPSLIHTPSSAASSVSSNASDFMAHMHEANRRPLPPRHNPYFGGSTSATKGVELVMPHVDDHSKGAADMNMNMNSGSIFPANSPLWDDKSPTSSDRTLTPVTGKSELSKRL